MYAILTFRAIPVQESSLVFSLHTVSYNVTCHTHLFKRPYIQQLIPDSHYLQVHVHNVPCHYKNFQWLVLPMYSVVSYHIQY